LNELCNLFDQVPRSRELHHSRISSDLNIFKLKERLLTLDFKKPNNFNLIRGLCRVDDYNVPLNTAGLNKQEVARDRRTANANENEEVIKFFVTFPHILGHIYSIISADYG